MFPSLWCVNPLSERPARPPLAPYPLVVSTAIFVGVLAIIGLLLWLLLGIAHAATGTAPGPTIVDLSPAVPWIIAVAGAILTACRLVATAWLSKHLGLQNDAAASQLLDTATRDMAALLYKHVASGAMKLEEVTFGNPKVAAVARVVVDELPVAVRQLGLEPEQVESMIEKKFGALLSLDPTVSVGPVSPTSAPAAVITRGPAPSTSTGDT